MADPLKQIARAAERHRKAVEATEAARRELRRLIRQAVKEQTSQAAIARTLGVSRQRVQKMLDD